MTTDVDSIVIGAGVVGLAIGRELARSGRSVLVLERNAGIGEETSSRNSEVIHAGIYYPRHSLKARLCVRGRELLYAYCHSHGIAHQRLGKLIVATDNDQLSRLQDIYLRGRANGVTDLVYVDPPELNEMEPALRAVRAILSPSTGIVDSHQLMLALQGDLERAGGSVVLRSPVVGGAVLAGGGGGFRLTVGGVEPIAITCRELINCAGLQAQAVTGAIDGVPSASIPAQYLSQGCYFSLQARSPFKRLIYPLPNQQGLGVHLTLDLQGQARFGPDARWVQRIDYSVDPALARDFCESVRHYYPAIEAQQLQPAYAGIRPKLAGPGEAAADFMIQPEAEHGVPGWLALYGIESPGLTAALAIGEYARAQLDNHRRG